MKGIHNVAALSFAIPALTIGGLPLSTTAYASPTARARPPATVLAGNHRHNRTVGQDNFIEANHSPTMVKGGQNVGATISGGQNSALNMLCPKPPCRISQKINIPPSSRAHRITSRSP